MAPKHKGFKKADVRDVNGLFAADHPSWEKKTGLQKALDKALKGSGDPHYGTASSPASTSVGQ